MSAFISHLFYFLLGVHDDGDTQIRLLWYVWSTGESYRRRRHLLRN